jgi:predicted nuclease of restriction endonuclease-like (RecB) superfamily
LRSIIGGGKLQAAAAVNSAITLAYWQVGKRINDEVLLGERAAYGKQLVAAVAQRLVAQFGQSFEAKNFHRMMQFAQIFTDSAIVVPLARQLSWSHILILIPLQTQEARLFYAEQASQAQWGKRELRRQIERKTFERVEIADNKLALATSPLDAMPAIVGSFKDPYFLDFLGLSQGYLLFFHRRLKRLVAVELKIDRFKAAHKGQMELYLNWLDKYERQPGEESPIGLILCAHAGTEQVELLNMQKDNIMVAEYWTELPPKAVLENKLHTALIEIQERLAEQKHIEAP